MSRLTRDGTAEPVSRDQIVRHERGQGNTIFPIQLTTCRTGNLTPVDPYSCYMCDHTRGWLEEAEAAKGRNYILVDVDYFVGLG